MSTASTPERSARPRTSTATRLAASIIAISLVSLVVATLVGVTSGEEIADDTNSDRLRAAAESAALDVRAGLSGLQRSAAAMAASSQTPELVTSFEQAFDELDGATARTLLDDEQLDELVSTYRTTYLDPLRRAGRAVELRDITPAAGAAGYLQYTYAVDIGAAPRPATIDDAGDGTTWSELHRLAHPVYREAVKQLDAVDLLLVAPSGLVVYSVNKRADLGSNLRTGPFSGSIVANTFRRVATDSSVDSSTGATASDIGFHDAVPAEAVGAVGSPIFGDEGLAGVVILTYAADDLTDLAIGGRPLDADETDTVDAFVFGADGLLRSDPRAYLSNQATFLDAAVEADRLSAAGRAEIDAVGSTVLIQSVVDSTHDAGTGDDTTMRQTSNVVGTDVFSVVVPVGGGTPDWFVAAEVDSATSGRGLGDFRSLLIVGAAVFNVLLAFGAVAWAANFMRPVRSISDGIGRTTRGSKPVEVVAHAPVEIQELASKLGDMNQTLERHRAEINAAQMSRLDLLRSLVPPGIAQRVDGGNSPAVELVPAASIVVIVVLGLSDLAESTHRSSSRRLIDDVLRELDGIAAVHGLDRIRVVGDAYFASCGHDRQFVDHAPRTISFAIDAVDAVASMGAEAPLGLAVGVNSGAVSTGNAGGAGRVYDVWGATVAEAHRVARHAPPGEVWLTSSTRDLLPDSVATTSTGAGGTFRVDDAYIDAKRSEMRSGPAPHGLGVRL